MRARWEGAFADRLPTLAIGSPSVAGSVIDPNHMSRSSASVRKKWIGVGVALLALVVLVFIFLGGGYGYTARALVARAFLSMSEARSPLMDHCRSGTLSSSLDHAALGLPKQYGPDPDIQNLVVRVKSPREAHIAAVLREIRSDMRRTWFFWKEPEIPAGAILAIEIFCEDRVPKMALGAETTVPTRYLPSALLATRSAPK